MSGAWRLLFTGKREGAWNMAADAAVLRSVESGQSPPTLRIYGWEPYCVSLGHFQVPERELDAAEMISRGWDFVVRPTGGRAVLHAQEITYSLVARKDTAPWCATLASSHARIAHAWAEALSEFSLDVEAATAGLARARSARRGASPPCFVSVSRSELAHGGRKVVGSAQRRTREAFLQHGSIPLTPEHERLLEVLRIPPSERAEQLRSLRHHAVSLGEIGALPPDAEAWGRALAGNCLRALEVEGKEGAFSQDEQGRIPGLAEEHEARRREFFATAAGVETCWK